MPSENWFVPVEEQDAQDLAFMREALKMAEEALEHVEIPVGCVFVHDGKIIARGRNRTNETKNATVHAELDALRHMLPDRTHALAPFMKRWFWKTHPDGNYPGMADPAELAERKVWKTPLKGVTLYVTIEPCVMCASALRQVGIEKCYYGAANDRFGGCGGVLSVHNDANLKYSPTYPAYGNYLRAEAIMILRRFYMTENATAPNPKNKANRTLKHDIPPVPTRSLRDQAVASQSSTAQTEGQDADGGRRRVESLVIDVHVDVDA